MVDLQFSNLLKGVYSDGDPPLPIPNREVKPVSADGTARGWESRSMPNLERASSTDSLFFLHVELVPREPVTCNFPGEIYRIFNFQLSIFNCFVLYLCNDR